MKLTKEKLAEIQAKKIPRLVAYSDVPGEGIYRAKEGVTLTPEELQEMPLLNDYFKQFCSPWEGCPGCESKPPQIKWGLARGEANCIVCGYPYRVFHRDIGPVKSLDYGFPYHPEDLEIR